MSMQAMLAATSGASQGKQYIDDVFSAYTYTGNGSTQTINNGIDLAGKGGMVWIKNRTAPTDNVLWDTLRGVGVTGNNLTTSGSLSTNSTRSFITSESYTAVLSAFNGNGFDVTHNSGGHTNFSGYPYISWTFRKAKKFFDVVTYTGDGIAGKNIAHNLGTAPGMIMIKRTDAAGDWIVYHTSLGAAKGMHLNLIDVSYTSVGFFNNTSPTATQFTLGTDARCNTNGGTYVAYIYAHDPSADGLIQCGSYTGTGSNPGPDINLGWEPQFILVKSTTSVENWYMLDITRSMPVSGYAEYLLANNSGAAGVMNPIAPTATGFKVLDTGIDTNSLNGSYIYMAIRRSNKPPISGTQVYYNRALNSGTVGSGIFDFADMAFSTRRNEAYGRRFVDRLRGVGKIGETGVYLASDSSSAEVSYTASNAAGGGLDNLFSLQNNAIYASLSGTNGGSAHLFRRAPGFMDVVCFKEVSLTTVAVSHNLGAIPELIIVKNRNTSQSWSVYAAPLGENVGLRLNSTAIADTNNEAWNIKTAPSAAQFVYSNPYSNTDSMVAYLFATLPGISKVFSYTGNGNSQTINCNFSNGARFILIKRTDAAGDWYLWDSARGIVAGTDPHLSLNTSGVEAASDDSVDPDPSGFIVNQSPATNINVNAATYIGLAIA